MFSGLYNDCDFKSHYSMQDGQGKEMEPRGYLCILGSFNKNSIGDKALLTGLIESLIDQLPPDINIRVLSSNVENLTSDFSCEPWHHRVEVCDFIARPRSFFSRLIKYTLSRTFIWHRFKLLEFTIVYTLIGNRRIIEKSIGLIVGGGNLLMDIFPNWPYTLFGLCKLFSKWNVPIVFAGVGALPIVTTKGRDLLLRSLLIARKIYVRDTTSRDYLMSSFGKISVVHPDFVFGLKIPPAKVHSTIKCFIAVNVAPVYGPTWPQVDSRKYHTYIDNVVNGLLSLQNKPCLVFFDTNYPTDRAASFEIIQRLVDSGYPKSNITYHDRLLTWQEVVELLQNAEAVFATRLHAGLLSLISKKPVVMFVWQPKVRGVFKDLGLEHCVVDIDDKIGFLRTTQEIFEAPKSFCLSPESLKVIKDENKGIISDILSSLSIEPSVIPPGI